MKKIQLSDFTRAQLLEIITLDEKKIAQAPWLDITDVSLSSDEQTAVDIPQR